MSLGWNTRSPNYPPTPLWVWTIIGLLVTQQFRIGQIILTVAVVISFLTIFILAWKE